MSHQQLSPAYSTWVRGTVIIGVTSVVAIAGLYSVSTQQHFVGRIPGWTDWGQWMTFPFALATEIYATLATVVWAASPTASAVKDKALHGVYLATGIALLVNTIEHVWSFFEKNTTFGWELLPILLGGALPSVIISLSVHLAGNVLSATQPTPEISDQDLPEETGSSDPVPSEDPIPSDPVLPSNPVPSEDPVLPEPPKEDPAPRPEPEIPAKPEPTEDTKLSNKRQARRELVKEIADLAAEMFQNGKTVDEVKKTLSASALAARYPNLPHPDHPYTSRNWGNVRDDALKEAVKVVQVA